MQMLSVLQKYYSEYDPLTESQVKTLLTILDGNLTETALEGFLIVCSRFIDEFGNERTEELTKIFQTHRVEGQRALLQSLEYMNKWARGFHHYHKLYPVTVIPPKPAFPQFKIIGIEMLAASLYRVIDSASKVHDTDELIKDYVQRTGKLPPVPRQRRPARRSKPQFHWCSYEKWANPELTRTALQILPEWSDCRLRATILTSTVKRSAYVAFNGDKYDPTDKRLRFYKYYFEPLAQDHPEFAGGGTQIALEGEPSVNVLEEWDDLLLDWRPIWSDQKRQPGIRH